MSTPVTVIPETAERARLQTLAAYGVLDTAPEEAFDRLTAMAADLFGTPMAMVSLIDAERQWFKSQYGLAAGSTPRSMGFCDHAITLEPGDTLVVEDATCDPRFHLNPFVTGDPNIRFYAGALLTAPDGSNLGVLCVIDTKPHPTPAPEELRRLSILAAMVVDELELRRATRLLGEQQRLLEMAERMSGVGHWRYQVADGQITWSDEVYRIHGVAKDSFNPNLDNAVGFFHPDDAPKVDALMAESLRTGNGYEFSLRLNRWDGAERQVVCKAGCVLNDEGEVTALMGVFQDVTDQVQALRRVERGQARYKLLADNVGDVITRIRMDGSSGYISPAVESLLGYKPVEMVGRPASAFVYGPDQPLILPVFADMAQGAQERTVQLRAVHKDGSPVWVEVHLKLISDAVGAPSEMVAVIRDITQRKRLEVELRDARAEAEAAAAVKAEFLANMSHELRTPLTSIVGFTALAAEQADLSPLTRTYVARVTDASQALLCTVNDILDFSKLEAGQVSIQPAPVALTTLTRATLDLFMPQAGAKDLTLTLDDQAQAGGLVIAVDPDRIRQILLNLVGNAVKFTTSGGITLRTRYDQRAGMLTIDVIDTGAGVSPTRQDALFRRFSQIDGSLTRAHGGTGLGLAICKGLVEAMGGEIGVDSRLGRGSRFWFRVPAPLAELPAPVADVTLERPTFHGVRVLVVDDHPANRELARLFLSGVGAEVTEAADGEVAATLAAELPFDVILMDVRMPRLDGPGALRRIRESHGPNDATPILAFTADAADNIRERLMGLGFQGVVAKPVESGTLIAAIARATAFAWDHQLEDLAYAS